MNIQLPLILVVCTGNSCRSQMAHTYWAKFLALRARIDSAGGASFGYVHPYAIQVMKERAIDISEAKSKHIDEFDQKDIAVVVTVSDRAQDNCPSMPSAVCYHWEFEDPAEATGCETEILSKFRKIGD